MDQKYDKNKAKELYDQMASYADIDVNENDFYTKLNDGGIDYAKNIYGKFKNAGLNLLNANDENAFLDSLKMNTNGNKMASLLNNADESIIRNNTIGTQVDSATPTINKDANTGFVQVTEPTASEKLSMLKDEGEQLMMQGGVQSAKDSVLPVGPRQNVISQMPETPAEQIIKNNEPKKVEGEVNQIGQDKVADAALTDNLLADVDARLAEWHKLNDAFIDEYESKMAPKAYEDRMVYGEHYVPKGGIFSLFRNKEAEENQKFIDANSAKYQDLIRQRNAIIRTKETAETMKQYADYDRQVAVGEQMSSMVDKGELSEADMKEL
jgi:hypothetical protein